MIPYLGFLLPRRITDPVGSGPPRDSAPRAALCDYCKRLRQETYARWDGVRVCDLCIDGQVNRVLKMRVRAQRRPSGEVPEKVGVIGDRFDNAWWDRQLA